jgi:hypothetical protein
MFPSGVAVNAKVTREEIATASKSLTAAVQLDNQCATSSDCTTAAIGARACGGPSGYVVFAIKSSNIEDIRKLAQLTTSLERQYNKETSVMSICSMVMAPTAVCDETSKCVAGSSSGPVFAQ